MRTCSGEYINGTSAIDLTKSSHVACKVVRIEFPADRRRAHPNDRVNRISRAARRAFEGSEMLCSLMFEDFRGCAYGMFARREIVFASMVVTVLAIIAIALGA